MSPPYTRCWKCSLYCLINRVRKSTGSKWTDKSGLYKFSVLCESLITFEMITISRYNSMCFTFICIKVLDQFQNIFLCILFVLFICPKLILAFNCITQFITQIDALQLISMKARFDRSHLFCFMISD